MTKFNKLAIFETTDKSILNIQNSLVPLTTFNTMRSEQRKKPWGYDTSKISPGMVCKMCRKILHPNRLRGQKKCQAVKLWCFNYGIIGHLEKVC